MIYMSMTLEGANGSFCLDQVVCVCDVFTVSYVTSSMRFDSLETAVWLWHVNTSAFTPFRAWLLLVDASVCGSYVFTLPCVVDVLTL